MTIYIVLTKNNGKPIDVDSFLVESFANLRLDALIELHEDCPEYTFEIKPVEID